MFFTEGYQLVHRFNSKSNFLLQKFGNIIWFRGKGVRTIAPNENRPRLGLGFAMTGNFPRGSLS